MLKKFFLIVVLCALTYASLAQIHVTFKLKQPVKPKVPVGNLFLAGSFNRWNPNDTVYRFSRLSDEDYSLEKNLPAGNYAYKITRGDWKNVESGLNGATIANRNLVLSKDTVVVLDVLSWADDFEKITKHTASVNVKIIDTAFKIPQLGKTRRVWIYLPPSYQHSKAFYPVIYMHDGQNLFDGATSGFGEWKIDESLDSLALAGNKECIVVGIDHGGNDRLKEYDPYDSEYGKGEGKAYVDFLVDNLKPYIDQHFRTKPDAKNTTIAGSSMGGLISMYAVMRYPKVYGNAGIFSPAFWIAKNIKTDLDSLKIQLTKNKFYFVAGALESKTMVSDMNEIYQQLNPNGRRQNVKLVVKADGEHKEWFWSREFVDFYNFIAR